MSRTEAQSGASSGPSRNRRPRLKQALRKGLCGVTLGIGMTLLSACASDNIAEDAIVWDDLVAAGQAVFLDDALTPSRAPEPTRALLAQVDQPLIRLTNMTTGGSATMVGIARRGSSSDPVIVWRGVNSETLTTRGGLLVATRGFGQDLMSSDLRALNRALGAGGGSFGRSHVVLQGNADAQTLSFECSLRVVGPETLTIVERSVRTTRYTEDCTGPAGRFSNEYWRDAGNGTLWQSRQWAGPSLGHLLVERVIK